MANIRIDLNHSVPLGFELTFKAPCDCNEVTGLKIYSPDEIDGKEYPFIDANGNDISSLNNLFKKDSMVQILINHDKAQIINGDTNGYLEAKLEKVGVFEKGVGEHSFVENDIENNEATGNYAKASGYKTKAISGCVLSVQEVNFVSYENNILTLNSADNFFDNNSVYAFRIENFNVKIRIDIVKVLDSVKDGDNWKFIIQEPISELNLGVPSQTVIQAILVDDTVITNNQYSEGNGSYSVGDVAHAEGYKTLSIDDYTHSEGWGTVAYGRASHTEGWCTKTLENYGHAEGCQTVAGYCSHAEGSGTEARGTYAHSEGYNTYASGDYSHTEGANCRAVGNFSHAENCNTKAIGNNTHSEGLSTQAIGDNSHVEGSATTSKGISSHIEGSSSIVAPEDSINCDSAKAISKFSVNKNYSLAYGEASHVEGKDNLAVGIASHTEGSKNVSGGDFSHSEGYSTKATGTYAHTEGYMTEATHHSSHAEGYNTKSKGDFCHTEGVETESTGNGCHSEGFQSKSYSYYSHAEGYKCMSVGSYSHAEGESTVSAGQGSHSEGYGTQANGKYQHAQGKWNIVDTNNKYAHIVGNGTSDTNRANIHTLDWDGNAWFKGNVYVGGTSDSTGEKLITEKELDSKLTYGTDDLIAGSELPTGVLYFVYE